MSEPVQPKQLPFTSLGPSRIVHGATALAMDPLMLQTLLDHIPTRASAVARDHTYLYANRSFLESMGLTAEQVIGRPVREVLGEAMYLGYLPVAERLFGGEALRWEGWMDYAGRGMRYYEQFLLPFVRGGAGNGEVEAIITFGRDVTELKQREADLAAKLHELETTQALKSSIVDHALTALVSTDAQGRVVEFNPAAEAMFGHKRAAVLGQPVSHVIIPEHQRAAHEAGLQRIAAGGVPRIIGKRIELSALRADGSEFPVEMLLWRTEVGGSAYYTASIFDLTERRDASREIERQREALRQSEKLTAMGSLLAGVAHELNNPLAIVLGRAALLEEKTSDDPQLLADARRIREAAERCGRIVRTFLNMARSKPAQRESVAMNDLVRAATDILAYNYRSHGIALELVLADALPTVMADGDQIGQVVLNLLVNAQQALAAPAAMTAVRRVSVSTGLEARRPEREPRVWLRVTDNGPGVSAEVRARIFEPFFTTKPEGLGTGLGLAVSRSIARDHGGDLVIEASTGQGASFRLSLPISGQPEAAESDHAPLQEETPAAQARVLVVDDEADIADLLRDLLEAAGYEVATAESGSVALALLAEARFDALVSDLHMPGIDGAALWREVRQRDAALARRMLFVTGDTLSPSVRQFLDDSGCASLAKPFTRAGLLARMTELLARG